MVRNVTGLAMQLMGYGYSKEYPAEQRLHDAWGWGIAGGTIDIQKINIAAALAGRRFNQRAWVVSRCGRKKSEMFALRPFVDALWGPC